MKEDKTEKIINYIDKINAENKILKLKNKEIEEAFEILVRKYEKLKQERN